MVALFARAVGHAGAEPPVVGDEGVPTTFPVSYAHFDPDYELRPSASRPWFGSGATGGSPRPSAGGGTRLHAEQHFEYLRPLRVGEVLAVSRRAGSTWEKTSSRGGTLRFSETFLDYADDAGDVVVVARSVSVIVLAETAAAW